jgi:hypothetical protein
MYIFTEFGRIGVWIVVYIYIFIPVNSTDVTYFGKAFGSEKIYCNNIGFYFFVLPEKLVLFRMHEISV